MNTLKILILSILITPLTAAQTYQIDWYVIGSGGGSLSSGNYAVDGTIGQPIVGQASSANYTVDAGFWVGAGPNGPDCYQYLSGDVNMALGIWPPATLGGDVTFLVNYFKGSPFAVSCLLNNPSAGNPYFWAPADANGDCNIMGSDVVKMVNYFRGATTLETCDDYEPPCWLSTSEAEADGEPVGWPNCETPPVLGKILPSGNIK